MTCVRSPIGTLALCGVPPFSGFYSKDAILASVFHGHPVLFGLAVVVACLTAFYMSRLFFVAFMGKPRSDSASHAQESPKVMIYPLMVLAVPSVVAGFFGLDGIFERQFATGTQAAEHAASHGVDIFGPFGHSPAAALFGLGATIFGISFAAAMYSNALKDGIPSRLGGLATAMRRRFYFDELYQAVPIRLHDALAALAGWIDRWIISGLLVKGSHGSVELAGRVLRLIQTGNIQTYSFFFVAGLVFVLVYTLAR